MKAIVKTVFVVSANDKKQEKDTMQEAQEVKGFLEEFFNISSTIEEHQKTVYEIEKGDRVYWLKDGKPKINRIDIVTDIIEDMWGDKRYLTKELNGDKIGSAYESQICLVI